LPIANSGEAPGVAMTVAAQLTLLLMLIRRSFTALVFVLLGTVPLEAQQPDSGTVDVTVREAMGMVESFIVRSDTRSATTDASGKARLVLPSGRRTLVLTRIGFAPKRVTVMVIADTTVSVTIDVAMGDMAATMQEVIVTATRTERLAGKSPLRVEVLDEMEVDENTLMAPSGITMLLNRNAAIRACGARRQLRKSSRRASDAIRSAGATRARCGWPLDHRCVGSARRLHGKRSCTLPMAVKLVTS